jgi:hypothetical protein
VLVGEQEEGVLKKLVLKLVGSKVKSTEALKRWVPLLGVTAYVATAILRVLGEATQAQQIEDVVKALGLPMEIDPAEITVAVAAGYGLVRKYWALIQKARGVRVAVSEPVLRTQSEHESFIRRYELKVASGMDWAQARVDALKEVLDLRKTLEDVRPPVPPPTLPPPTVRS